MNVKYHKASLSCSTTITPIRMLRRANFDVVKEKKKRNLFSCCKTIFFSVLNFEVRVIILNHSQEQAKLIANNKGGLDLLW